MECKCIAQTPGLAGRDAPEYSDIITSPMDLSTVKNRLEANFYKGAAPIFPWVVADVPVSRAPVQVENMYAVIPYTCHSLVSAAYTGMWWKFAQDLRQIWLNCQTYNEEGSEISDLAAKLGVSQL